MFLKPIDPARPTWSSKDPWSPIPYTPGAYPPSPDLDKANNQAPPSVLDVVRARKDEYVRKKSIKVKIGTWNVAALGNARKDLGAWFVQGLGVKGLAQDLAGLKTGDQSTTDDTSDSEVERVEEQEARHQKKSTTLPRHDAPGIAHGDEVDLYVLGLQEVIDISSMTEAMKPYTDPNPAKRWKRAIKKALPYGYGKVVEEQLLGLLLLVYASPKLAPDISSVDSTHVGTGLMGYLGNKGAVSARLLLGQSTRLVFINSHLAAGADATALNRRIWDTQQICSRTKFHPVGDEWVGGIGQSETIGDEDIAFWFGDLNYRLDDIPGEDVRRLLLLHARNEYDILNKSKRRIDSELGFMQKAAGDEADDNHYDIPIAERPAGASTVEPELDPQNDPASLQTTLKALFAHDQLRAQQRMNKAFHEGWREGDINFLPTYKYDIGSVAMFDSGEKKRSPSWCDRILYRTRHDYEQYKQRAEQDTESRKRDEDMKRRGLEDASSQEDVLFDYDPEADGGDEDDDEAEQRDNNNDAQVIRTKEGYDDTVVLEEYISHQRVLSSDHKPLSAVFTMTYESVDHELRAKVHQQVTRDFDKAENEARPSITLVLDNRSPSTNAADSSTDPELKVVDFGGVRYHVPYQHHLTIANTGQIQVIFAFINRPMDPSTTSPAKSSPSWLNIYVQQEADKTTIGPTDLGNAVQYKLMPGETTTVELSLEVTEPSLVKQLNNGDVALDDILVLRVSNGRDYFIPVKGTWLQTCFYRSVDELVRVPSGVRSLTMKTNDIEAQRRPADTVLRSAPQEIFTLTDLIPPLVERAVADWEMLHEHDASPWRAGQPWPFVSGDETDWTAETKAEKLAEIREALDTGEPLDDHLSPRTDPTDKLNLLSETLTSFLASLSDGIITAEVWHLIETRMQAYERAKQSLLHDTVQEIVMEAISTTPVHSVSLTFLTFMLNRIISEVSAGSKEQAHVSRERIGRLRSSTSASAMSDVSLSSIKSERSTQSKRSFLPNLTRKPTNSSNVTTSTTPDTSTVASTSTAVFDKVRLTRCYAEVFAPLVIRSDSSKLKAKEKKVQLERQTKALEAFLNQQP